MHNDLTDSNEELYSLSATTTTNIFDFDTAETYVSNLKAPSTNKLLALLKRFSFGIKLSFLNTFRIIFEVIHFLFYFIVYFRSKAIQLVQFFDISKDRFVATLMWRRGLLFRPATHGGVMVVTALAILAGGLFTRGQIAAQDLTLSESVLKSTNTTETIVPTNRPRSEVMDYKVAAGDTLSTLADKFSISVETVRWANNLGDTDTIQPGATLRIPPISGVVHRVSTSDTLDSVAKHFSADKQTIADFPFNYMDDSLTLRVGQTLYIPNGVVPKPAAPAPAPAIFRPAPRSSFVVGSGLLSWPVPAHINQGFSWFHPGIDLGAAYGTPVYAAAGGRVVDAKKQTYSFGWYCIIDIGNGYTVAYAHMSDLACFVGQSVGKGQYIGAVGMTGRATGPHLHLEVRRGGAAVNPLSLLR